MKCRIGFHFYPRSRHFCITPSILRCFWSERAFQSQNFLISAIFRPTEKSTVVTNRPCSVGALKYVGFSLNNAQPENNFLADRGLLCNRLELVNGFIFFCLWQHLWAKSINVRLRCPRCCWPVGDKLRIPNARVSHGLVIKASSQLDAKLRRNSLTGYKDNEGRPKCAL